MPDLSQIAGLPLFLDGANEQVFGEGDFQFYRTTRTIAQLKPVLYAPDALPESDGVYHMFFPEKLPDDATEILARYHLTYSPVLLPPRLIGDEYIKTSGHYHPNIPGTAISYPEVYTGLYGHLLLFLQKRDQAIPATPQECVLIALDPGVTVTIPPEYAHVLINPTREPALMAGLFSPDFKPDYTEVHRYQGLAYYLLNHHDEPFIEPNRHYADPPPLLHPDHLDGTIFAPPDDTDIPLWTSFLGDPERYAFLTQPEAAAAFVKQFTP
jgi:glucose-6-phosphate isomerase